ncbi:MAG: rhodanese-like domain-containing protein, partial [Gammaproteobacteria bacterium]|nr:rhodanese-like domain-containing protein [Gammaproteobacteria bacterium]
SNAESEQTPEQIDGTTRINAEQLINLAETLADITIIDARIGKDRIHGYIEGSISLPNTKTDCESLSKVVKSANHPTVYYCNGPKCGRSVKSIKIAQTCGYNNIYWYRGGFEDWKEKDYPFLKDNK